MTQIAAKFEQDQENAISQTVRELHADSLTFVKALLADWISHHAEVMEKFKDSWKPTLAATERDLSWHEWWSQLDDCAHRLDDWLESLQLFPAGATTQHFLEEWKTWSVTWLKDRPEVTGVFQTQDPRAASRTSSERLSQTAMKLKGWVQSQALKTENTVRRIAGRPQLEVGLSIHDRSTAIYYVHHVLPIGGALLSAWENHARRMTDDMKEWQARNSEIFAGSLRPEMIEKACKNDNGETVHRQAITIEQALENLETGPQPAHEILLSQAEADLKALLPTLEHKLRSVSREGSNRKAGRDRRPARDWQRLRRDFEETRTRFDHHVMAVQRDWQRELTLDSLQLCVAQSCVRACHSIRGKVAEEIIPAFRDANGIIEDSLSKFRHIQENKTASLESALIRENRSMLRLLRQEHIPRLVDMLTSVQLDRELANVLHQVRRRIDKLPESSTILRESDSERQVKNIRTAEISLKELVDRDVFQAWSKTHASLMNDIRPRLRQLIRELTEIDQIVEFNLEAALNLLEKSDHDQQDADAKNVAIEGLERTKNQIEDLIQAVEEIRDLCHTTLVDMTIEFERRIQELSDSEKVLELQLRLVRAKTQARARQALLKSLRFLRVALPSTLRLAYQGLKRVRESYARLRKIAGLAPVTRDVEAELTRFLSETRTRLTALPYIYQRLYRFEPLTDDRFFSGREKELEVLKVSFETWQSGDYATTAMVGEKGSGRTTVLNFAENIIYKNQALVKLDLSKTVFTVEGLLSNLRRAFRMKSIDSMEDLESEIVSAPSTVCIVENLHNMFLRTVNGFNAIERFLLFMSKTHRQVHWVVTCGLYGWRYLDKTIGLSTQFAHTIFMSELSNDDIKNVILKRHRVSGYELSYEAPPSVSATRKFKRLRSSEEQQAYLGDLFFSQLEALAAGNITVAILFWLRAIQKISGEEITIWPLIEFDPSFLSQLPTEDLFAFAAFLQHETLTPEQLTDVFNQDLEKSHLLCNRLKNKGILAETPNGYQIHYLLYRPVVRTLKNCNILH